VGVSADHVATLEAYVRENRPKHLLLSDFRRQMLPAWDALVTDEKSPIFRYPKRAYFVLDRTGTVKYVKIQPNPLQLLKPEEVVQAIKDSGAR
jgi:peroxiredoxin